MSGFMLSSAVMKISKSLYVVAALRLPSRSSFTRRAPSNSGSLPRGCTQTRYVCLAGVSDCGVAVAIVIGNHLAFCGGSSSGVGEFILTAPGRGGEQKAEQQKQSDGALAH